MIEKEFYENDEGYRYILDRLKEMAGETETIEILFESLDICQALHSQYRYLNEQLLCHLDQVMAPRIAFYIMASRHIGKEEALPLFIEAAKIDASFTSVDWFAKEAGFEVEITDHMLQVKKCPYCLYCGKYGVSELAQTFCLSECGQGNSLASGSEACLFAI